MTSKETTKKPKSKKQLRHEAQEKIALEIRAKATTHMKKHNVTSQAEIIAPVIKQKANERDNTLMLVRKRKAMQLQKQQEQQRMQSNAKKQKVPPIEECTSSIEAAAAALLPKGPTWHEASIDDVPELIKGAARVGYGVPVTTKLPAGTVLPKGWIIVEESKTKRQYFWNKNTNRVCWGDPRNVPLSSSTSSFPPAPLQEVEPFHIAIEHGQHRSYYWEAKSGKTNFDSINEKIRTGITITGICANKAPRFPSINANGRKAATVVNTPKVTGVATSWVPRIAAISPDSAVFKWV